MTSRKTLAPAAAACAAALTMILANPARAAAQTTCWDFATLSQTERFGIGESFTAPTATIYFISYMLNGNWTSNPAAIGYANNSAIAGGPAPEFRTYLLNTQVIPNAPLDRVTLKFGFTNSLDGSKANLGVNGELVEVVSTMTELNGQILGLPALGNVLVTVNLTNTAPERGTIELQALTGQIYRFAAGGRQFFMDDVCMTP